MQCGVKILDCCWPNRFVFPVAEITLVLYSLRREEGVEPVLRFFSLISEEKSYALLDIGYIKDR